MNRFALVLLLVFAAACAHTPAARSAQPATGTWADLAIMHVNVVDVANGSIRSDQTVLISGNRIAAVAPSRELPVPAGAQLIDGRGRYLIPGLWDMHAHAASEGRVESFFRLLVANGVTGFRDPFGSLEAAASARAAIAAGELTGPVRIIVAGNLVDGPPGGVPGARIASTPEAGRRTVDSLHAADAPFIKVYSLLSPATYFAIAERSRELGLPIVGHVPMLVRAADASDAGQRSIEHLTGVLTGCSTAEEAILAEWRRIMGLVSDGDAAAFTGQYMEPVRRALGTQDEARCRRLAERFVANGTWQVPTLVSLRGKAYLREAAAAGDARTRYFTPPSRWIGGRPFGFPMSEAQWEVLQAQYEREKEIVRMMAAAGVAFMAGSDTATPWAFPGFGLHDELALLVEAGLTPLQALQSATLNPARYLEATDSLGTTDTGKLADLVLLEANPLEDIQNTLRIAAVVVNGRYLDRSELDELLAVAAAANAPEPPGSERVPNDTLPEVLPNDNRSPAGTLRDGVLEVHLDARLVMWPAALRSVRQRLDQSLDHADNEEGAAVLAFGETDGPASIPGPLIRVPQGTEVRVTIRNSIPDSLLIGLPPPASGVVASGAFADPVLIVHGLRAGTVAEDTVHVARGAVRQVRFRADTPGTYVYRGAVSGRPIRGWLGRDAQLAGAIIVDPAGTRPDPAERIFVITMLDQFPDAALPPPYEDLIGRAINGRSWPETERLHYELGDTVRWRWINASGEAHPMHLHGFHFRVLAKGDGAADTTYAADATRLAVTELMEPGSTFHMVWIPTTAGNWIMHCHILDHVEPLPARDAAARDHDVHDVARHALEAMGGLVLGITVAGPASANADAHEPQRRLRLLAQQGRLAVDRDYCGGTEPPAGGCPVRAFLLQHGIEPAPDSVAVPGPPLVLTRGERTAITVVNRLSEPTTVHWHGMELESVFDGVAGWSRTGERIAPLIAPGDSFTVHMTPPRAGTFIYHTHMDESWQLVTGMFGPLLVLEPGTAYDADTDRVFILGGQAEGGYPYTLNGRRAPEPAHFRSGTTYRLRFISIVRGGVLDVALASGNGVAEWRSVAKDGADLPPALRLERPARIRLDAGETYDVTWTPQRAGDYTLDVVADTGSSIVRQTLRVQ